MRDLTDFANNCPRCEIELQDRVAVGFCTLIVDCMYSIYIECSLFKKGIIVQIDGC